MSDKTEHRGAPWWASYAKLALALTLSTIVMFVLTMSMIHVLDDFFWNLSNFYMALIMVFPMGIIMIAVMWGMFSKRWLNVLLILVFAAAFIAALLMGRDGVLVGDRQFLQSMIPHHSRAILVCEESAIADPRIIELCDGIIETQQEEIDLMKQILERYDAGR